MGFSSEFKMFFDEIKAFCDFHHNKEIWFRGQTCDKPLNSGLFRIDQLKEIEDKKNYEETAYRRFISLGHPFLNGEKDWELLFIMQHHGVKTRLLDWSPSLLTALFFATQKNEAPVLWMLHPRKLNKKCAGEYTVFSMPMIVSYERYIMTPNRLSFGTAAIFPTRNTTRQVIQQGVFTVQGDGNIPLEEECNGTLIRESILKKIEIPESLFEEIRYFLKLNNITQFTMYPDLDGLSNHIHDAYLE
ncbi:FRG domain-containing protein [Paenibacillus peoriae]|uniref:FRG domain-containing protein n=1 Tax=Paenibacillus peoriae TaxID=59893 RepID=UPI003F9487BE